MKKLTPFAASIGYRQIFLLKPLLLLLSLSCLSAANPKRELGFIFAQTAQLKPAVFQKIEKGPFQLPFVAEPKFRFYPQPDIPSALKKSGREGWVRAALKIGKDGEVKDLKILETEPKGIVEESGQAFFKRVIYAPQKKDGKLIEFETDAILVFKFGESK
ncbi:MAG: energy transducer TonB [Verrucomicrobia bacterium]|nr:energy transducer TonB [Verrucomicrobiota bacterium]